MRFFLEYFKIILIEFSCIQVLCCCSGRYSISTCQRLAHPWYFARKFARFSNDCARDMRVLIGISRYCESMVHVIVGLQRLLRESFPIKAFPEWSRTTTDEAPFNRTSERTKFECRTIAVKWTSSSKNSENRNHWRQRMYLRSDGWFHLGFDYWRRVGGSARNCRGVKRVPSLRWTSYIADVFADKWAVIYQAAPTIWITEVHLQSKWLIRSQTHASAAWLLVSISQPWKTPTRYTIHWNHKPYIMFRNQAWIEMTRRWARFLKNVGNVPPWRSNPRVYPWPEETIRKYQSEWDGGHSKVFPLMAM